jgi:hypothetical protein
MASSGRAENPRPHPADAATDAAATGRRGAPQLEETTGPGQVEIPGTVTVVTTARPEVTAAELEAIAETHLTETPGIAMVVTTTFPEVAVTARDHAPETAVPVADVRGHGHRHTTELDATSPECQPRRESSA